MSIGENIRELRKEMKITQEQLAEYLNISSQAVSKWETGIASPEVDLIPKLAIYFQVSIDALFGFDKMKIEEEVEAIVMQSMPLRERPAEAEKFYRKALEKYPNNPVLLNCLLMVIPNERYTEKIEIGELLLSFSTDAEIKYDVLRLMAQACHLSGEAAMAEYYLEKIPELYFLKTEIAASIRTGEAQLSEIIKTEEVCFGTLAGMLAFRAKADDNSKNQELCEGIKSILIELINKYPEHRESAERIAKKLEDGSILEFYS